MLKLDGQKLDDGRWFTGSVERNKDPILNLLKRVLPHTGLILEIGSGTGQHVAYFAKRCRNSLGSQAIRMMSFANQSGRGRRRKASTMCAHPSILRFADFPGR